MDQHSLTVLIAAYAAVVSTVAVGVEVRRLLARGPKLVVKGSFRKAIERQVDTEAFEVVVPGRLVVSISNRGSAPTTVTVAVVYEDASLISRIVGRFRGAKEGQLSLPIDIGRLPHLLDPGAYIELEMEIDDVLSGIALEGRFSGFVLASHRDTAVWFKVAT